MVWEASAEKFVDLEVQNRDLKRVPDSFPEFGDYLKISIFS